jgi:hypothetical protein
MILLLYMILLYVNSYTSKICMFVVVSQYTSLFTVYESPLIRISAYMNLRSTDLICLFEMFVMLFFCCLNNLLNLNFLKVKINHLKASQEQRFVALTSIFLTKTKVIKLNLFLVYFIAR